MTRIEKKLAARHLDHGALALYDLSSSYFEGVTCPLAAIGYSRDHKRGTLQVNYGLLTDRRGCPVAISVHEGNAPDCETFMPMLDHVRHDFALYLIRTSLSSEQMDRAQCVRSYKSLTRVEQAFRSIKTVDLKVRPIHHYHADRVRAHLLLCMLAYYVEWHIKEAWRELSFADTAQAAKDNRDPVAPAQRSAEALRKVHTRTLDDGPPAHSIATLMSEMASIVRNTCRTPNAADPDLHTFEMDTRPNAKQRHALELIDTITL